MTISRRRSSGDLIADRRFDYGEALAREGNFAAAADLFEQALERAPHWPPAWRALARARLDGCDRACAIDALRECLRLDPSDEFGAGLELSLLDASVMIDTAPPAYVAALFNAYAPTFEKALVERLGYTTPTALARLLRASSCTPEPRRFTRALDLGCGTGLAGDALRQDVAYLEGVDLAPGMLDIARAKGVYDALAEADILHHLSAAGPAYDLVVAADVFTYIGDLEPILASIAARLAPEGRLAFSVEKAPGVEADWSIRASLRFAHCETYLRRLAAMNELRVIALEESVLRQDRGADIDGLIVIFGASKGDSLPMTDAPADQIEDALSARRVI